MENIGEQVSGMPYAENSADAVADLAAYDQLPTMIRKAVSRFPVAIESPALLEAYESGSMSAIQILTELRRLELEFYHNAYADRGVLNG